MTSCNATPQTLCNTQEKETMQVVSEAVPTLDYASTNAIAAPSLFSHMPDFSKVLSRPFTATESKMHYWFQSRDNLTPQEIQALLHDIRFIRYTSKVGITHRVDKTSVILSLCGFSSYIDRDVFLRMLRYAFQPRLIYASEIAQHQWEAVLVLNSRKYSTQLTFNGRDQFIDHVQKFCDTFKLSICLLELLSWTDPATVTAIQRIQKGFRIWGNWENFSNYDLKLEFEMAQELKSQAMMNDAVRSITNRNFTTGNMIHLHHELHNALLDNNQLMQANNRVTNALRNCMRYLLDVHTMLNNEATQIQHLNVTTYTFRLADNQQRLRSTSHNISPNSETSSNMMPFTDLSHFNALVQDLQQQNQRNRSSVADMRRSVHNFLNRNAIAVQAHDIEARNSRNRRNLSHNSRNYQPQTINPPNPNLSNSNATTPLYTIAPDESTTQYASPQETAYPSSPRPQLQSPLPVHPMHPMQPVPPPQNTIQHNVTEHNARPNTVMRNIEVIDLTQDDQPLTPQLSYQISRQANFQLPENYSPENEMPSLLTEIANFLPTRRSQARVGALPGLIDSRSRPHNLE
jgi:hypothetical protein